MRAYIAEIMHSAQQKILALPNNEHNRIDDRASRKKKVHFVNLAIIAKQLRLHLRKYERAYIIFEI
jgi:hypothetical protein